MSGTRLNLVVIRSRDIEAAKRFYETLGLSFSKHKHGKGLEHFASENADFVFEIYPLKVSDLATTSTRLGFVVESCDQVTGKLREQAFKVLSEPANAEWGRVAVVEDFDGHKVEVLQKS